MTTATIDKLFAKYESDMLSMVRLVASTNTQKAIKYTPIDEGSARASWTPSKNSPKTDNINIDEGDNRRHDYTQVINSLTLNDDYYCANGQPYIEWLEYMFRYQDGKYIKNGGQPGHMLTRTKAEWSKTVNDAIRKVRGS